MCKIKQNLNLNVFNMITRMKTLTKDIPCGYKCKFDGRPCNLNEKWNNDKQCKCKKTNKARCI